jgi:hypothetical protein
VTNQPQFSRHRGGDREGIEQRLSHADGNFV